jgi:RNA polymerase sigma-70 factor (ECF subfamily)
VDDWFNECYECYEDSIFRFCLVKTSSREVALDLVQETFTRLWDMIRDNKEIEHPRALLYTIARNAITDYYRKKKTDSLESLVDAGHEPSVPARAETDAEYEHVLSAIQKLEEPYKEVVYLRYVEELPPRDIATALQEPVNVISIRITRGMKKLRAALG